MLWKVAKTKEKKKKKPSVYLNGIAIPYFSIGHMLLKSEFHTSDQPGKISPVQCHQMTYGCVRKNWFWEHRQHILVPKSRTFILFPAKHWPRCIAQTWSGCCIDSACPSNGVFRTICDVLRATKKIMLIIWKTESEQNLRKRPATIL